MCRPFESVLGDVREELRDTTPSARLNALAIRLGAVLIGGACIARPAIVDIAAVIMGREFLFPFWQLATLFVLWTAASFVCIELFARRKSLPPASTTPTQGPASQGRPH